MINKLIKLANTLDEAGFKKEADQIDSLIRKNAAVMALPLLIPAIIEAIILAGLATAAIYIVSIALYEAYNYLKELEKERALNRENIKEAVDRGFNSPKYKEALRENSDLGPGWEPPPEIMTIIVSLLAGAFGVEYLLRDKPSEQEGIRNRIDREEVTEIDLEEIMREINQLDPDSKKREEEEKPKIISCLAIRNTFNMENNLQWFYFDSPGVPEEVVTGLCSSRDDALVGKIIPGIGIYGSPEAAKFEILNWFCTNYPNYDSIRVHNQGSGGVYCSANRAGWTGDILYQPSGKMHGPWKCK